MPGNCPGTTWYCLAVSGTFWQRPRRPDPRLAIESIGGSSWANSSAQQNDSFSNGMELSRIYYSRDSILPTFRDNRRVEQMVQELRNGRRDKLESIEIITVVPYGGKWYSVDNRRLYTFKQVFLGSERVPVFQGTADHRFHQKFTTVNGGTSVRVRRGGGGGARYAGRFGF